MKKELLLSDFPNYVTNNYSGHIVHILINDKEELTLIPEKKSQRPPFQFGCMKDKIVMPDNFNELDMGFNVEEYGL